jgi:hypothetical protein
LGPGHGISRDPLKPRGLSRQITLQRFDIADYHLQQIIEVMRDTTGQLSNCFHLLRLPQRILVTAQLLRPFRYLLLKSLV